MNSKNHLDLILFYIQLKQRSFFQMEIELIKKLMEENKRIIFILIVLVNLKTEKRQKDC